MAPDAETGLTSIFIFDIITSSYLKASCGTSSDMSSACDLTEKQAEELLSALDGYVEEEIISE
jgi:hypothetical protein